MRWLMVAAALWAGAAGAQGAGNAPQESGMEQSADMLLIGIPAVAYGLTFLLGKDDSGDASAAGFQAEGLLKMNGSARHDLGLALFRAGAVTYGLKYAVTEERPDGSGDDSFPSGHTSISFAGAEFIRKQYGWGWGAPAYAAASYVGWSRVETQDHWAHDVAIGALIGVLSNHDFNLLQRWGWRVEPALLSGPPKPAAALESEPSETAPGLRFKIDF